MKKTFFYFILITSILIMIGCTQGNNETGENGNNYSYNGDNNNNSNDNNNNNSNNNNNNNSSSSGIVGNWIIVEYTVGDAVSNSPVYQFRADGTVYVQYVGEVGRYTETKFYYGDYEYNYILSGTILYITSTTLSTYQLMKFQKQ